MTKVLTINNVPFLALLATAYTEARKAAAAEDARLGPEASRGFDCGFAWVDIPTGKNAKPIVKQFVAWLKNARELTTDRQYGYGTAAWQFWNPSNHHTQSISTKMAGAQAFALVLRNGGIEGAVAGSRLD